MYLVPNIHPGSGSAGVPTVQANFAGSPADWTTLDSTSTMPPGGSISRAGNAMLYDATGKLTYAPNNLVQQSQALATSPWSNYAQGTGVNPVVTNNAGVAPDNTNTATRVQLDCGAGGTSSDRSVRFQGSITLVTGTSYIISVYVKAYDAGNVGKTIRVSADGLGNLPIVTLTSSWQRVHLLATAIGTGGIFNIETRGTFTTQTADVLVWGAQIEAVTYQTTPSTYVATTTSAYYGPRFDYDPVTLAAKGLLVEGTRTNLLNFSQSFATSGGAQNNWADTNITRNSTNNTSPDGTGNALRVTASAANGTIISSAAIGTSAQRVLSVWLRRVTGTGNIQYTLDNGSNWTTQAITSTWARYSFAATTANQQAGFRIVTSGDAIEIWGVQLEAAAFSSSYVSTGSSTVARAAETFALTGYANRLVEAFYIDEETGANYSGNSALSTGTVTISPPTFGWVTSLRAYTNAYAGSISSPSWLSFSRAGNAMYYDSTGTLTFAANNLLLNTATLSTQTVTTGIIPTCDVILSFKGTGSVAISGGYTGTLAGTGASDRVFLKFTTTTASLTFTVTGTVTEVQLERVTYQTQPSLYVANTGSQSYGPRYDYDPSTVPATPRGLLIEESRANLLQYSDQFDNAYWLAARSTVTANQTTSPDGTPTADLIADDTTASNTHAVQRSGITISAAAYTLSVYAKNNTRRYLSLRVNDNNSNSNAASCVFDLQNGSISGAATAYGTFSAVSGAITNVGNNWYRLTLTFTSSVTSISAKYELSDGSARSADGQCNYTGNGSSLYLWGAQLEAGSFATSYIPTTTASVTRAADVAQLTGSALTTAGAATGSAIVQTTLWQNSTAAARDLLSSATTRRLLYSNSSNTVLSSTDGTTGLNATIGGSGTFTGGAVRSAVAWNASGRSLIANNGTLTSDAVNLSTGATATLGGYGTTTTFDGWIASMALYNQRLPDAILKQKSSVGAPY